MKHVYTYNFERIGRLDGIIIIILIIVAVCAAFLATVAFKMNRVIARLARNLENLNMPDLVEDMSKSNRTLSRSVDTHRETIGLLPDLVSRHVAGEVRKGIEPVQHELRTLAGETQSGAARLADSLAKAHDHFTGALMTLNSDGHLSEWVDSFREAAEPIKSASSAIQHHYETAEQLLDTTGKLIAQWSGQRRAVDDSFKRFSSVMEQWAVDETTHFRDVEHRIMNRLEEVAGTNSMVAQSLSELQTAQTKMAGSQEEFSETINQTASRFGEILDITRRAQNRHIEIIRTQEQLQAQLKTIQGAFQKRTAALDERMNEMMAGLEKIQGAFFSNAEKSFEKLTGQTDALNNEHAAALGKLKTMFETAAVSQTGLIEKHQNLVDHAKSVLSGVPSKKMQTVFAALLAVHLFLTILIAYGILIK